MTDSKWATIARQCLLRRLSPYLFSGLIQSHDGQTDRRRLFAALVDCRQSFCAPGDPLISLYIDTLGNSGALSVSDALLVLTKRWNNAKVSMSPEGLECYNHTVQDLTMVIVSSKYKLEVPEARLSLIISSKWLLTLARQASREDADLTGLEFGNMLGSLAFFVTSLAATDAGLETLSPSVLANGKEVNSSVKDLRTLMRRAFELCLPLYPVLPSQLMERINNVLKHLSLLDNSSSQNAKPTTQATEIQALQFQVSIAESQLVASKAGTMLFLSNLFLTCSTIDDGTLVNWLSSRHHNDCQAILADLTTASFSILKAQHSMPKRSLCTQQCRIFLQNKLPALLSVICAASFNSFSPEQAITETWHHVVPLLSDQYLLSVGAQFLHVCSLIHLLPGQRVNDLVGNEDVLKGLSRGLYTKDVLVDQVTSNHARGPKLIEELIRGDGSAGFISQAVVEVCTTTLPGARSNSFQIMHTYCQSRETQYLKDLANTIIRKPAATNCIALFIRPSIFLGPLCGLLDEWQWDEIHGGREHPSISSQLTQSRRGAAGVRRVRCYLPPGLGHPEPSWPFGVRFRYSQKERLLI